MAPTGSAPAPLRAPPTDFDAIVAEERSLLLPSFTSTDAFALGSLIRTRIPQWLPSAPPAVIHICLANSSNVLFHAITEPPSRQQGAGVVPDNDDWVRRKKAVVLRWGISSYAMHLKMKGDQEAFADKFMLAGEKKGEYAIHGGGVPIRVPNVEGIVGVIVVSGLKQHEDHQAVIQCLEEYTASTSSAR